MKDRFKELSTQCMKELTEVFERMDDSNVRELLEEIKKTPRIFLLAAGREGLATKSFAMRLMHLGKESFWIWDDTTPSIGEGDLMICACGSANVGHENYVADMAKKNGAKLALITPSSEGFLLSMGERGALLYNGTEAKFIECFKVKAVDSTAAGDTFGAALAIRLCKGSKIEDAILFAHAAAGICVSRLGAQTSIPTEEEVENFLTERIGGVL